MVDAWIPYGKTEVCARIPTRNFLGYIQPKENEGVNDPKAEIVRALDQPIGTQQLRQKVNFRPITIKWILFWVKRLFI